MLAELDFNDVKGYLGSGSLKSDMALLWQGFGHDVLMMDLCAGKK